MKTRAFLLSLTTVIGLFPGIMFGQTVAMGHISAEVVESVSASSYASTAFELPSQYEGSQINNSVLADNISLGKIQISSGQDVACNLTIKPATLTDKFGNDFSLEPVASYNGSQNSQRIDGAQTIDLAGKALMNSNQASGLYQGSYTLVFAYN
jgi:hypothetical protein